MLTATDEVIEAGPFPKSADIISLPPFRLRTTKSICLESERRRINPSRAQLRTNNLTDTLRKGTDTVVKTRVRHKHTTAVSEMECYTKMK